MNRTPDHEYAPGSIEGMIATVAAMYPGEPIVCVDDPLGTDVRLLRSVAMSDEEREAVLAGDAVTRENGARVERVQPSTVATDRGGVRRRGVVMIAAVKKGDIVFFVHRAQLLRATVMRVKKDGVTIVVSVKGHGDECACGAEWFDLYHSDLRDSEGKVSP